MAWKKALGSQDISFSIEEYMPLVGHSLKDILQMIRSAKKIKISDEIIAIKNNAYKYLQKQGVSPIQEMVNFALCLFKNKHRLSIQLALASSAPKKEILTNLKQIGLENIFDLIISGSDDLVNYVDDKGTNKPRPYIYANAGLFSVAVPSQFSLEHDF